jgi:nucleoside-diphosphate-sugar epimerase
MKSLDLKDIKFGLLTAKEKISASKDKKYITKWKCLCDCGNYTEVTVGALRSGNTTSCGCYSKKIIFNRSYTGYKEISSTYFTSLKRSALKRNIEFNISKEDIWNQYIKQDKKCNLSRVDLTFITTKNNPRTASVDRIDSNIGYIKNNIQIIHKDINRMKSDFKEDLFIKTCKNINYKNYDKKILIWGGAGYIGCVLTQQLLDLGYKVKVCDNLRKGGKPLINFIQNKNFEFEYGDILNKEDIIKQHNNIDYIVLLSGVVGLDDCNKHQEYTKLVNIDGWNNIAKYHNNIPIISASTGSVYGEILNGLCTEETEVNPLSLYAVTKLEGEKPILDVGGLVFRYATAGGVSPQMRFNLLPNTLTFEALEKGSLILFEHQNMRTFIDIRDFARSIIFGIENFNNMKYKLYNIGDNNNNITKGELANIIKEKTKCELFLSDTFKDPDARNYQVDYKKINDEGFYCKFSINDMIDSLINCYNIWKNPFNEIEE